MGQDAHANSLHVHEERKLVVGHMCNGPNVLAGYHKPVLVCARVLGRKRHHQGVLVHELAFSPPARILAKHASLSVRHCFQFVPSVLFVFQCMTSDPERASEGVRHAAKAAQGRAGRASQEPRRCGEAEGCRGRSDSR